MSARRFDTSLGFHPVLVHSNQFRLTLAHEDVCIRKSGIEFRSLAPIAPWTEMSVTLESGGHPEGCLHCNGVVVNCSGDRHRGYVISLLFTGLSRQAQARLNQLAFA